MKKESKVEIHKVIRITAGGNHAWVDSNKGTIRKPLESIPEELLNQHI